MEQHPISNLFKISLECIKDMIDVNTICGKEIKVSEETSIIPISKVHLTFATGGLDQSNVKNVIENHYPFGGATGGTMFLTPIAFLVIHKDEVKLMHVSGETHLYEKVIDVVPELVTKIKDFFQKDPEVTNLEIIERKIGE